MKGGSPGYGPLSIQQLPQSAAPTDVLEFAKYPRFAIDPVKPGYSWIIIPVRHAIFQAMADVRGALDPRSGSLVLFRPWRDVSCPIQHIYAIGIHLRDDDVPYDVAATDYMDIRCTRSSPLTT